MTKPLPMKSPITAEPVARYVVEQITKDSELEHRLRLETMSLSQGHMISGADVGALLAMLVRGNESKRALEIGTFTGYTALKIASALPSDGKLICCDINPEWTAIALRYWEEAKLDSRIDLRLSPALNTLDQLLSEGGAGQYDFAFIDADKGGYESYYENCLELLRPNGMIVLDNMLWDGDVANLEDMDKVTVTLRNLNLKISRDSRVHSCLLTVGDGLMLAQKIGKTGP